MNVRDNLPDAISQMQGIIREVGQISSEIKAPQTIGSSGVMTNAVQSLATSDITIPANDSRDVLFQFTPSDLAFGGGLAFRLYYSINGGGYTEVDPSYRLRVGTDNVQSWQIFGNNGLNNTPMTM